MSRQQLAVDTSDDSIPEEDVLRARFYALLAQLLVVAPTADVLASVRALEGDEDSAMGQALTALAKVAAATTVESVDDEYTALFIGVGRGELLPFASYYMSGFLHEKPLANLRGDMAEIGIGRAEDLSEPEDQIGVLAEMMHGLITGAFGAPATLDDQKAFFDAHIRPRAAQFFADLEAADSAVFYMPVATIGRLFIGIECDAFEMAG